MLSQDLSLNPVLRVWLVWLATSPQGFCLHLPWTGMAGSRQERFAFAGESELLSSCSHLNDTFPTKSSSQLRVSCLLTGEVPSLGTDRKKSQTVTDQRSLTKQRTRGCQSTALPPPSSLLSPRGGAFYRPKDNRDSFINLERKLDGNSRAAADSSIPLMLSIPQTHILHQILSASQNVLILCFHE